GDSAADILRCIVDGPVEVAADVLHEGPCPADDGDAWYEARARFLMPYAGMTLEELKAGLAGADQVIADACANHQPIELWFEHDLFDQLALIRTLDVIVRLKPGTTVSLIC